MTAPKGITRAFTKTTLSLALLLGPTACAVQTVAEEGVADDDIVDGGVDEELSDKALVAVTYQAEARTAQSGCVQASNHSGYTGAGFMDYGGSGTWIEWNDVSVPASGQFDLKLRYANGSSGARQAAILVNGVSAGNVAFNPTGAWTTWSTATLRASLRSGRNTIRVVANTSSGGPNVDRLDISGDVVSSGISHVATTVAYDSNGQDLTIARPAGTQPGDLLVLALHRTDDDLPLYVDGWTRVAECYKRDNGYQCSTEENCTRWHNDDFCSYFGDTGREGHDLAQSVFYRAVGSSEPSSYQFDLNVDSSGHPGWAVLTALRGASTTDPIRDWANKGCDGDADSLFPSVYGQAGDMVLLSQSFDDQVAKSLFGAPSGMSAFGYVSQSDEAGFMFGRVLSSTGETGTMRTTGSGASSCKDALVSMTVRPR